MKLRTKLVWLNMIVLFLVMITLASIMIYTSDNYNIYAVRKNLENQSEFAIDIMQQYLYQRGGGFELLVSDNRLITDAVERFLDCDVQIVPNTAAYFSAYINEGADKLIDNALRIEEVMKGNTVYYIVRGTPRVFYLDFPFYYNEEFACMVEFTYPLTDVDATKQELVTMFVIMFGGAYWILIIFSFYFSYKMLRPLEKLQRVVSRYGKGDFSERVQVDTGDEIEALARSFNTMGGDIDKMIKDLVVEQEKQKRFLDNVTHEIRTPLTNIMGYADLIGRLDDVGKKDECIKIVKTEGERMLKMVNNLLELSRINQYEEQFEFKCGDPSAILFDVLQIMELRFERNGFSVERNLEPSDAIVDAEKLKQVFLNIVDNALKYSGGNKMTFKTYKDMKNDMAVIEIADNGKGIPDKVIHEVTVPFFRVDKGRSRDMGGAGLGLALCKDIVDKHKGNMDIENLRKGGLLVRINIPLWRGENEKP